MKKLVADMHMHTLVSGHAYGTIREMAEAAREKELLLIGITEHAPGIPGTVDPIYYSNLAFATHSVKGVKIMYGSEINILNDGTLSLPQKYIDSQKTVKQKRWKGMPLPIRTTRRKSGLPAISLQPV